MGLISCSESDGIVMGVGVGSRRPRISRRRRGGASSGSISSLVIDSTQLIVESIDGEGLLDSVRLVIEEVGDEGAENNVDGVADLFRPCISRLRRTMSLLFVE